MKYSEIVHRIGGKGRDAWNIHFEATQAAARGEDIIMLSIGEAEFPTPPEFGAAAVKAIEAGDHHYSAIRGRGPLREAIAEYQGAYMGQEIDPMQVIVLAGAQNGLIAASLLVGGPGTEIIAPTPTYVTYEAAVGASGAHMVAVPQKPENGFRIDPASLEAAVTDKSRAIMIANPNNPTGVGCTREELEAIAEIAKAHDLWVIMDEVYASMAFDHPHYCMASLPGMAERTMTIGSLSKSHAMTGWRLGWMVGPRDLIDHAENLALCMLYGVPGFSQEAATVAVRDGAEVVTHHREVFRRRRDLVYAALRGVNGISINNPDAGMFVLADIRATGLSSNEFSWGLFKAEGVSVLDASAFGESADGHIRIAFTVGEEALTEACKRIARYVGSLNR